MIKWAIHGIILAFWFENSKAKAFPIPEEAPVIQIILAKKLIISFLTLQYTYFPAEMVLLLYFLKIAIFRIKSKKR